jgi:site-specific recombinase XerC
VRYQLVTNQEQNQLYILEYLDYCDKTRQNCSETVNARKNQLDYLLRWVGNIQLSEAYKIKVSYPSFLTSLQRPDSSGRILSISSLQAVLNVSRMLFQWAKSQYPERFESIQSTWIDSLRPPRHIKQQTSPKDHVYYTLDDMMKIASLNPETLAEKRGKAAMIFMYLSGMRVGAFLTLPIGCVDLGQMKIYQIPSMGVSTKFHKAGITTLLNIPELLKIVREWDEEIRKYFPTNQTWYAPIRPHREKFGQFYISDKKASPYRSKELRKEMIVICNRAIVTFRSAHKLRHGHAIFGIKNSKNIQDLKAISQNLMHSSLTVTDGIYGNLSGEDFTQTISKLGNPQFENTKESGISIDLVRAMIKLQENPALLNKLLNE